MIDSRGTATSVREMLSYESAAGDEPLSAVTLRLERRRESGCSDWTARLDAGPGTGAAPEDEVVVGGGGGLELLLDLVWRSRKVTLD